MNNDLISRSYLKNLPFERVIHTDFGETAIPIEEIDNAPTVESEPIDILFLCDHKKCGENFNCFECNHTSDIRHAINFDLMEFPRSVFVERVRPQGKWIYDEKLCNWKCSECGETPKTIGYVGNREFMTEHFKYCNHCGAIMKGGVEHGSNDR